MIGATINDLDFFFDNLFRCENCGCLYVIVRMQLQKKIEGSSCPSCRNGIIRKYLETRI